MIDGARVFRCAVPLSILLVGWAAGAARAQTPGSTADRLTSGERIYQPGEYIGATSCATSNCHGKAAPANEHYILQNEYTTWFEEDYHRGAHQVLGNEDSTRIVQLLGLKKPATQAPECLTCHSLSVPAPFQANKLDPEDGISCEACHGPAGGWIDEHTKRGWTHEQSVQRGMYDLRDIGTRLRNCLGCHLGNSEHEVDHRLLAAGHPDLIFELDTFTAIMPPHWDGFKGVEEREPGRPITHGARAWAVGQIESIRYGLLQLIRRIDSGRWPEFTELTCDACHHDLGPKRWSAKGYEFNQGLAPWNPSRWIVARHVVQAFAPEELPAIQQSIDTVARTVTTLAPREQVQAAADSAVESLERVTPRVLAAPLTEARLLQILRVILADPEARRRTDRKGAQQALFSVNALAVQLNQMESSAIDDPFMEILEQELERYNGLYSYKHHDLEQPFAKLLQRLGPAPRE